MNRSSKKRLARLTKVRLLQEEVSRMEWGRSLAERAEAETRVEETRTALEHARQEVLERRRRGDEALRQDGIAEQCQEAQLEVLKGRRIRLRELDKTCEDLMQAWAERRRDRQGLERLTDRARLGEQEELSKLQDRELDEWSSARGARNVDRPSE